MFSISPVALRLQNRVRYPYLASYLCSIHSYLFTLTINIYWQIINICRVYYVVSNYTLFILYECIMFYRERIEMAEANPWPSALALIVTAMKKKKKLSWIFSFGWGSDYSFLFARRELPLQSSFFFFFL